MGVYFFVGGGYTPTSNTVAYYPLGIASKGKDESGNNYHLTQTGTITYGNNGGIDCAYFNGGYLSIDTSLITGANPRTACVWFYRINAISEGGAFWGMGSPSSQVGYTTYVGASAGDTGKISQGNRQYDYASGINCPINGWNLLVVTFNGTAVTIYLNNTQIQTNNLTLNLTSGKTTIGQMPSILANAWKGYMSNFILENIVWDSAKRTDYYNLTKSLYGIS